MFHQAKAESSDFLPSLTQAFVNLDVNNPLSTVDFTEACAKVMPIFDHIGASLELYFVLILLLPS